MVELGPDQIPERWDAASEIYERAFESYSIQVAEEALRLAGLQPGQHVLDVAAGPGALALSAARLGAEVTAIDFSPAMTRRLRTRVAEESLFKVRIELMDGQDLQFPDDSFDSAYSVFGLIFFPDRVKALREIQRVLKPGGRAAIVAVNSPERFCALAVLMRALNVALPDFPPPQKPPSWIALNGSPGVKAEMETAGFQQICVHTLTRVWTTPSPEWLWEHVPAFTPGFAFIFDQLDALQTKTLGKAFVEILRGDFGDGPVHLEGEVNIGVGVK
jgi:ubiquinone/menaquinone biosynthesis C-methylase UbiE